MNYKDKVNELSQRGSLPGLDAIRSLLDELGNPHEKVKIIHVAGTNGKGSVCAFMASVIQEAGYRVGRYLSPVILSYEEKFQINGVFIDPCLLQKLFDRVMEADEKSIRKGERPATLFEVETAIAFLYFAEAKADFALVECGMGGLEDATNVIQSPLLSIITSISFDHMQFLGETLPQIAGQKAGIIKDGCPVVLQENPPQVIRVISEEARAHQASLTLIKPEDYQVIRERFDGNTFRFRGVDYEIGLPGRHQISNAVTAVAALQILFERIQKPERKPESEGIAKSEGIPKSENKTAKGEEHGYIETIRTGLKKTRWPGRLEIIDRHPLTYRDGAHNADGAAVLARFVEKHFTNRRIIYIMGILSDKEYEKMVESLIPSADSFYVFTPANSRGLAGEKLAAVIEGLGKKAVLASNVREALQAAKAAAGPRDVLIVCGSLSFMQEM